MFAPTKIIAALSIAASLAVAGTASAEEFRSNGRTSEVRYGDLNLANAADQKVLKQRISRAASKVCVSRDLNEVRACRAAALKNVDAPISQAIARAQTGDRYADAGQNAQMATGH
jgi:UrcA family protein